MKQRHIKTIPEKFGYRSVLKEFNDIYDNAKSFYKELYNALPYIGILYVPFEFHDLWYDMDEGDLITDYGEYIRLKIVEVNDKNMIICHYDSHHKSTVRLTRKYDEYLVEGNICIKR